MRVCVHVCICTCACVCMGFVDILIDFLLCFSQPCASFVHGCVHVSTPRVFSNLFVFSVVCVSVCACVCSLVCCRCVYVWLVPEAGYVSVCFFMCCVQSVCRPLALLLNVCTCGPLCVFRRFLGYADVSTGCVCHVYP